MKEIKVDPNKWKKQCSWARDLLLSARQYVQINLQIQCNPYLSLTFIPPFFQKLAYRL